MHRFGKVPLLAGLAALVALPLGVAAGSTAGAATTTTPQLMDVRASSHDGFDRVVWQFKGGLPEKRIVEKVPALSSDGEGRRMRIAGSTILQVTMYSANGHDVDPPHADTSTDRLVPGMTNVAEIVQSGDFEATISYGVGLVKDQPYRLYTLTSPSRVVLDVRTDFTKAFRGVHFLDVADHAEGNEPYTERVVRKVPAGAPASAVLHHLFAGPTAAERAYGLSTVRSGATGFRNLSVRDGVARVTLTGGCNSRGATFTVANLITPTLKQFGNVDHVKIYDPSGRTSSPTGHSDSIPECLEP